jgi:hypothetical protein
LLEISILIGAAAVVIAGQGWTLSRMMAVERMIWALRTDFATMKNSPPPAWFVERVDELADRIGRLEREGTT